MALQVLSSLAEVWINTSVAWSRHSTMLTSNEDKPAAREKRNRVERAAPAESQSLARHLKIEDELLSAI
jgi:hypothetical protein